MAIPKRTATQLDATTPTGFPTTNPAKTATATGLVTSRTEIGMPACVGQREEGHDGESHPGVQGQLQPFDRRQRFTGRDFGDLQRASVGCNATATVGGRMRDHLIQQGIQTIIADPTPSRCQQPEHDAGDGRMDAGGVNRNPHHRAATKYTGTLRTPRAAMPRTRKHAAMASASGPQATSLL